MSLSIKLRNLRSFLAGTERWADSLERIIPLALFLILAPIAVMAFSSDFNKHPDEYHHYGAAKYYLSHWLPPPVGAWDTVDTYSTYGVSYLNELDIVYFLAGKFARFISPLIPKTYLALRLFNVFLFFLLALYCACHPESRLVFLILLITPQVWYIFSYFNSDAFSLFISIIMICELMLERSFFRRSLEAAKTSQFIGGSILMGLLFGLLFLCKRNYYIVIGFILFLILWQIWQRGGQGRKQMLLRYLFIIGLGLAVFLLRYGYDEAINGWNKAARVSVAAEQMAHPEFKPSLRGSMNSYPWLNLRAKGLQYYEMFSRGMWHTYSFKSFFGSYAYVTIRSPQWYYITVLCLVSLFLIYIISGILVKGVMSDRIFMIVVLGFMLTTIFISSYHSWVNDYQPQGRYLFPILGMLGLLLYENRNILNRFLLVGLAMALCGLSAYSFIFVGISGMMTPGA